MVVRRVTSEGVVLDAELPDEAAAYLDADWVRADAPGPLPALLVGTGWARWREEPSVSTPDSVDPDRLAGALLTGVAREAARAAAAVSRDGVEVMGSGLIAETVRLLTSRSPSKGHDAGERPRVVIDTTGDPSALAAATERLADLGTLILAGEPLARRISLDLYPDIHRRGLKLVGVAPPLADRAEVPEAEASGGDAPAPPPAELVPGAVVPQALWYRLSAAASA